MVDKGVGDCFQGVARRARVGEARGEKQDDVDQTRRGTASPPQRTSAAAAWILGAVSLLNRKETSQTVTDSSQRGALRREAKRRNRQSGDSGASSDARGVGVSSVLSLFTALFGVESLSARWPWLTR